MVAGGVLRRMGWDGMGWDVCLSYRQTRRDETRRGRVDMVERGWDMYVCMWDGGGLSPYRSYIWYGGLVLDS